MRPALRIATGAGFLCRFDRPKKKLRISVAPFYGAFKKSVRHPATICKPLRHPLGHAKGIFNGLMNDAALAKTGPPNLELRLDQRDQARAGSA